MSVIAVGLLRRITPRTVSLSIGSEHTGDEATLTLKRKNSSVQSAMLCPPAWLAAEKICIPPALAQPGPWFLNHHVMKTRHRRDHQRREVFMSCAICSRAVTKRKRGADDSTKSWKIWLCPDFTVCVEFFCRRRARRCRCSRCVCVRTSVCV